jgi:hypothetical protein
MGPWAYLGFAWTDELEVKDLERDQPVQHGANGEADHDVPLGGRLIRIAVSQFLCKRLS